MQWIWKKHSKYFSDNSDSPGIEEKIIKQVKLLKSFDMKPLKAIPKKKNLSEEENNFKEEVRLVP